MKFNPQLRNYLGSDKIYGRKLNGDSYEVSMKERMQKIHILLGNKIERNSDVQAIFTYHMEEANEDEHLERFTQLHNMLNLSTMRQLCEE
jgi:hypothetical protein